MATIGGESSLAGVPDLSSISPSGRQRAVDSLSTGVGRAETSEFAAESTVGGMANNFGVVLNRPNLPGPLSLLSGNGATAPPRHLGPTDGLDLTVSNIEVTQAIQTLSNSVGLVANKPTMVRVYVGVSGADQPVDGVDAILRVFQDGIEIKGSPFQPDNGPITAKLSPDRSQENDTLNFRVPSLSGNVDFVATVNPEHTIKEVDYDNNDFALGSLNFACRRAPTILYVPTDYRPTGGGENLPNPDLMALGTGDAFVRAIYPIADLDYRMLASGPLLWNQDINRSDGQYLATLAQMRLLTEPVPDFLYGWLPGNPFFGNGEAAPGSNVAFGNTELARFQRSFAHELGHLFGLAHNNRSIAEVGMDVDNLVGLGRIKTSDLKDVMFPGLLTYQAWVDAQTYAHFYNHDVLHCPNGNGPSRPEFANHLVVTGVIARDGRVELNPVYQVAGTTALTPSDPTSPYRLRVQDQQGHAYSVGFDVNFRTTDSNSDATSAAFSAVLPANPAVARISLVKEGNVLAELERSPHAPLVHFTSSPVLRGQSVLTWNAVDADGAPLAYSLQYSPDGGQSFVPLAVNLRDGQYALDSARLPESRDGIVRLLVSDGLNTETVEQPVSVVHAQ